MKRSLLVTPIVLTASLAFSSLAWADLSPRPGGSGGSSPAQGGNSPGSAGSSTTGIGGSPITGSAGSRTTGGGGSTVTGSAGASTTTTTENDGCSIRTPNSHGTLAGLMLAAGAGLLLIDRRRRR